ncbi:cytochrome c family protein [Sphingomonas sp. LaA6.9]|uniref:c-type cytochrome n=1 Tax=Sphingomonas sp. LaA6.9 TaxID=2919914 RepID=UPI001F4F7230|nr:cytochrome C [Sphingomonas sp. LaA6.9]MCJ8155808.1 cytochrome C [Sphingomonas sp. LaA6.9]
MTKALVVLGALALLTACGKAEKAEETASGATTPAAEIASARPVEFQPCTVCHTDKKGDPNRLGPNLFGVVGARAGAHAAGFNYSPAMKEANFAWDRAKLDAYLEMPAKVVPGTRMVYPGQKDPTKRKIIIDYLETLH